MSITNVFHHDVLVMLAARSSSYLEVGVQEGDSVAAVVMAKSTISVTLCDTWGGLHGGTNRGSYRHVEDRLISLQHKGRRTYLDGDSTRVLPRLTERFDLVHIDGDHTERGAFLDLTNAWPLTKKWLVVHDVFFKSVRDALFLFVDSLRTGSEGAKVMGTDVNMHLSLHGHGTAVIERRFQ